MVHNSAKTKDSNINARGKLCVGNRRGPSLSESRSPGWLRALKDDVAEIGEELALQDKQLALNKARLDKLDDKMLALGHLSTGYRQTRVQFIDTFKRDELDASDDDSDGKIIREGYMAAEEANAIADAALYALKERSDVHIFEELYGLEPLQVLRISEC